MMLTDANEMSYSSIMSLFAEPLEIYKLRNI